MAYPTGMRPIQWVAFFLAVILAAFFVPRQNAANASQMVCVTDSDLQEIVDNANETLKFEGLSNTGIPFKFYANDTTWSVFYFNVNAGVWCTSPNMTGEVMRDTQA